MGLRGSYGWLRTDAPVSVEDADIVRAERTLAKAREASGAAAYAYFFHTNSPGARRAYVAALAVEAEAEALLETLKSGRGMVEARSPTSGGA